MRLLIVLIILTFLISCTQYQANTLYRTNIEVCTSEAVLSDCKDFSIQESKNPKEDYLLAFVEFDDQGQFYDRKQMEVLIDKLSIDAAQQDLLVVVFVHGWKNNAQQNNKNVKNFRQTLIDLSQSETKISKAENRQSRKIIGVYLGWQGQAARTKLTNNLTFWDRKKVAHRVGEQGVLELLLKLEQLRNVKVQMNDQGKINQTRLVVIGHSFGGAIVYSALGQLLIERFINTQGEKQSISDVKGFGDLVILINPAFEASRFASLKEMADKRETYFQTQKPVLAILTSEADLATKKAFLLGRSLSTRRERYINTKQKMASRIAVGHYQPYITHFLRKNYTKQFTSTISKENIFQFQQAWKKMTSGSYLEFANLRLEHLNNSAIRNPYLNIQVDKAIIPDHSNIYDESIRDFVMYLILLSTNPNK